MCPELKSRVQDTLVTGSSGRQLPVLPQLVAEQGPGLTSLELKQMGRDTIAGLIAGILQKYTKREVRHWDTPAPTVATQVWDNLLWLCLFLGH